MTPDHTEARLSPADTKIGRLQREALRVLREHHAAGMLPTNGRFLFYELEQQGIVSKVRLGARRADQDLTDALLDLRERLIVPWTWIVDETREFQEWGAVRSGKAALLREAERILLDRWWPEQAPILITESRSLAGVLETLAYQYAVPMTSCNGQVGGHLRVEVLPRYRESRRVLYLGDWDLAGGQIEQNTRRVLVRDGGEPVLWERLAITEAQIAERGLTPIHKNDQRFKNNRGHHEAWETEALSQQVVVAIVRARLDALLPTPLADVLERQDAERASWLARLRRMR
jgi:hypothetical protein